MEYINGKDTSDLTVFESDTGTKTIGVNVNEVNPGIKSLFMSMVNSLLGIFGQSKITNAHLSMATDTDLKDQEGDNYADN